jgi:hypothetical protein
LPKIVDNCHYIIGLTTLFLRGMFFTLFKTPFLLGMSFLAPGPSATETFSRPKADAGSNRMLEE